MAGLWWPIHTPPDFDVHGQRRCFLLSGSKNHRSRSVHGLALGNGRLARHTAADQACRRRKSRRCRGRPRGCRCRLKILWLLHSYSTYQLHPLCYVCPRPRKAVMFPEAPHRGLTCACRLSKCDVNDIVGTRTTAIMCYRLCPATMPAGAPRRRPSPRSARQACRRRTPALITCDTPKALLLEEATYEHTEVASSWKETTLEHSRKHEVCLLISLGTANAQQR